MLSDTSTAQVKNILSVKRRKIYGALFLANCTLGEWAAWGQCKPSNGISGNGTRQRYKEELLPSRNGGFCVNKPESEDCTKDFPTGMVSDF